MVNFVENPPRLTSKNEEAMPGKQHEEKWV